MAPGFISTTAHGKYYKNKSTFRFIYFIQIFTFFMIC
jgi:hypothetical protein